MRGPGLAAHLCSGESARGALEDSGIALQSRSLTRQGQGTVVTACRKAQGGPQEMEEVVPVILVNQRRCCCKRH